MAVVSNTTQTLLLTWLFTTGTATRPTAWYVALHNGTPTASSPSTGEVGGAIGYSRKSATFSVSGQQVSNTATVTFGPATGSWGTVSHVSVWDASGSGSGNCLYYGPLGSSVSVASGDSAQFAASALVIKADS